MSEETLSVVGQSVARSDGLGHVTGRDIYTFDRTFPGMLHLKIVRSPVHHARLRGVDLSEAEKVPGFVRALSAADVPHNVYTILGLIGVEPEEEFLLTPVGERVRYKGEPIIAIAADTEASDNQRSRALESLDYQVISVASSQVEELVRSSQFEDAHKVLAEINESDLTDKGKQVIDRLRLWLSEAEGWDTVESLYNNGDWDKLEVAAKKYLVELPKGAHRRQVQHLLDEAVSQKKPAAPAATPASAP